MQTKEDKTSKDRRREYNRAYYQANGGRRKEYYLENKDVLKEASKMYREQNRESTRDYAKAYSAALKLSNPVLYKQRNTINNKRHKDEVSDCYARLLLSREGFPKEGITPELIDLKRVMLKTKRL